MYNNQFFGVSQIKNTIIAAVPLTILLIATGCVATMPTQPTTVNNTTTPRPAPTGQSQSGQPSFMSSSTNRTPAPSRTNTTRPQTGQPSFMSSTTSRAPAPSRTNTGRPQSGQPSFMANTTSRTQMPSAFQPATTSLPTAPQPGAAAPQPGVFRTVEGDIWLDEECSMADVNGVNGETVLNNDGSQLIIIDQYGQYLATAPYTDQCAAVHRMLAEAQVNPQPAAAGGGFADPNTIWIDESCDQASVGGIPGYVAQDEMGHLYIESAGDIPTTLAEVPMGVFAQCGY